MQQTTCYRLFVLVQLLVATSCEKEPIEVEKERIQIVDSLTNIEGYLTYQGETGYLDYKTRDGENEAPLLQSTTICDALPDSLKNTKVLFSGYLIEKEHLSPSFCIADLTAIDLCNNPHLSIGFNKELHPICVYSSSELNSNVPDMLVTSQEELGDQLSILKKELASPVDLTKNDIVFFRQGVQPSGWDIVVDFLCDDTTRKCTFRHTIRDWSHTKVGGGLNFYYAIPKVPQDYSFEIQKETLLME